MQKLDNTIQITAPEFIVFRYHTAGPSIRLFAVLVDHMIIAFLLLVTLMAFAVTLAILPGRNATGILQFILFLVFFIVYWLYFFLFEWLNRGRTPGKMAFQIRVSSADGTALDVNQVLVRNLVRLADMLPVWPLFWLFFIPSGAVGALSMFASAGYFQRLGDLAARTLVVRDEQEARAENQTVTDLRIQALSARIALRHMPSPDFVRALNEYVLRRPLLHPERRNEIAAQTKDYMNSLCQYDRETSSLDEALCALHHVLFQLDSEKSRSGRL